MIVGSAENVSLEYFKAPETLAHVRAMKNIWEATRASHLLASMPNSDGVKKHCDNWVLVSTPVLALSDLVIRQGSAAPAAKQTHRDRDRDTLLTQYDTCRKALKGKSIKNAESSAQAFASSALTFVEGHFRDVVTEAAIDLAKVLVPGAQPMARCGSTA